MEDRLRRGRGRDRRFTALVANPNVHVRPPEIQEMEPTKPNVRRAIVHDVGCEGRSDSRVRRVSTRAAKEACRRPRLPPCRCPCSLPCTYIFFVRLVRVQLHLEPTCTRGNTRVLRVLRFYDRRSPFSPRMSRRRCSLFHRPVIRHVHLDCSWSGRTVLSRWDLFRVCFQGRQ